MGPTKTPLFVRLPKTQAVALDRLASASGRSKQHLVSEWLAERLTTPVLPMGRVDIVDAREVTVDDVLTLEQAAALLKVAVNEVRTRAEQGDLPGRCFSDEWRFSRAAVLGWLANGESQKSKRG